MDGQWGSSQPRIFRSVQPWYQAKTQEEATQFEAARSEIKNALLVNRDGVTPTKILNFLDSQGVNINPARFGLNFNELLYHCQDFLEVRIFQPRVSANRGHHLFVLDHALDPEARHLRNLVRGQMNEKKKSGLPRPTKMNTTAASPDVLLRGAPPILFDNSPGGVRGGRGGRGGGGYASRGGRFFSPSMVNRPLRLPVPAPSQPPRQASTLQPMRTQLVAQHRFANSNSNLYLREVSPSAGQSLKSTEYRIADNESENVTESSLVLNSRLPLRVCSRLNPNLIRVATPSPPEPTENIERVDVRVCSRLNPNIVRFAAPSPVEAAQNNEKVEVTKPSSAAFVQSVPPPAYQNMIARPMMARPLRPVQSDVNVPAPTMAVRFTVATSPSSVANRRPLVPVATNVPVPIDCLDSGLSPLCKARPPPRADLMTGLATTFRHPLEAFAPNDWAKLEHRMTKSSDAEREDCYLDATISGVESAHPPVIYIKLKEILDQVTTVERMMKAFYKWMPDRRIIAKDDVILHGFYAANNSATGIWNRVQVMAIKNNIPEGSQPLKVFLIDHGYCLDVNCADINYLTSAYVPQLRHAYIASFAYERNDVRMTEKTANTFLSAFVGRRFTWSIRNKEEIDGVQRLKLRAVQDLDRVGGMKAKNGIVF